MSDKIKRLKTTNMIWILIWSIFFGAIAVLLAISLASERRSDSGSISEDVKTESVTCESGSVSYPFFEFDKSSKKDLKIVAITDSTGLKSVSLQYILYYNDSELIDMSEQQNHVAMNLIFAENGLGPDANDASYAKLDNALRFSLYTTGEKITDESSKFFLLSDGQKYDADGLMAEYEKLGMSCKKNN